MSKASKKSSSEKLISRLSRQGGRALEVSTMKSIQYKMVNFHIISPKVLYIEMDLELSRHQMDELFLNLLTVTATSLHSHLTAPIKFPLKANL